ncbi:L-rhamnose mutarotase [Paraburkholderia sp. DGU8]|uniref:L-rhamnose mutarotase n=1 Tax=Paraburkholderia sp. DGU8 TaxID=3161997 RepID=UPI0034658CDF
MRSNIRQRLIAFSDGRVCTFRAAQCCDSNLLFPGVTGKKTCSTETDDTIFSAQRIADAEANDPVLMEWQRLMWNFQVPTPWTPPGEKWVEAALIFDLSRQQ